MKKRKKRRLEWNQWLSLATEYYRENGHLLIEEKHITGGGYRLGRWIERQRAMYNGTIPNTLTEERIEALNAIEMVWKLEYRSSWDGWIEEVKKYYEDHGDLIVPRNYKNGNCWLGNWISVQRKKYSKGLLTENQINDLEACGMSWCEMEHRSWDAWYRDAAEYYSKYGNLLVPMAYRTKEGRLLGKWVATQRARRDKESSGVMLTKEQIGLLDRIGMVWDMKSMRDEAWNTMYKCVREYRERNGKLPLWPRNLETPDGRNMSNWVRTQRTRLSKNRCTNEETELLTSLGIYPWKTKVD